MILFMFVLLIALVILGIPIAFSIGMAAVVSMLFFVDNVPLNLIVTKMFSGLDSFPLMAIPFYILAGELLNGGGLTQRIIDFAKALVGHIRGGLAHVSVIAAMMFGGVSGSASADVAAIGSVMIPAMEKNKYGKDFAVSLIANAGTLGPIIPPSILMVIFGSLTGVSIGQLFIGGFIPGIIVGLCLMATVAILCVLRGYKERSKFSLKNVFVTGFRASGAILVPLIIIGGTAFGIMTPTEAGVGAVLVALFLGVFVYRNITSFQQFKKIFIDSALSTSIVMIILSFSSIFSELLIRGGFQKQMLGFLTGITDSPMLTIIILLVFVFIMGFFVDTTPILIMFSVPFLSIATQMGYDPVHFGVVMVMAAAIGGVTPPVGVLLILACSIAKIPVSRVIKVNMWFVMALFVATLITFFIPASVTWLPSLIMK